MPHTPRARWASVGGRHGSTLQARYAAQSEETGVHERFRLGAPPLSSTVFRVSTSGASPVALQ
jgi:hypothetical protein